MLEYALKPYGSFKRFNPDPKKETVKNELSLT